MRVGFAASQRAWTKDNASLLRLLTPYLEGFVLPHIRPGAHAPPNSHCRLPARIFFECEDAGTPADFENPHAPRRALSTMRRRPTAFRGRASRGLRRIVRGFFPDWEFR